MTDRVRHPHNFQTVPSTQPYPPAGETIRVCQHCKDPETEENRDQSCRKLAENAKKYAHMNVKKERRVRADRRYAGFAK